MKKNQVSSSASSENIFIAGRLKIHRLIFSEKIVFIPGRLALIPAINLTWKFTIELCIYPFLASNKDENLSHTPLRMLVRSIIGTVTPHYPIYLTPQRTSYSVYNSFVSEFSQEYICLFGYIFRRCIYRFPCRLFICESVPLSLYFIFMDILNES